MNWLFSPPQALAMSAFSALCVFIAVIIFTRIAGLRSFSKLSAFDFAVTVAIGSLVASTVIAPDPSIELAIVALASLYVLQIGTAALRTHSSRFARLVNNEPLLLMDGAEILHDNLKVGKLTTDELTAKLREANVIEWSEIKAVILETTGNISVLHGSAGKKVDERLLENIRTR